MPTSTSARTSTAFSRRSTRRTARRRTTRRSRPGYWKLFGAPNAGFWCCHGTGVENFSKLADSVYFHDDDGIWVNLFVPSEVRWKEKGVRLVQETRFPESDVTTLTVRADETDAHDAPGSRAVLGGRGRMGEAEWPSARRLRGAWRATSCSIERGATASGWSFELPMRLHAHAMPDDSSLQAVMYGPLVLVGRMGTEGITAENRRAEPTKPRTVPEFKDPAPPPAPQIRAASGRRDELGRAGSGQAARVHDDGTADAR